MKDLATIPRSAATALTLCAVFVAAVPLAAQHMQPPPAAAYAVENATVVNPDGSTRSGVTVVVRDGLIRAMGPNVSAPDDARVLEGDSLRIYPGLVDAEGQAEFRWPGEGDDGGGNDGSGSPPPSWDPPRDQQGFTPHRRVADHLTATGEDFEELRRQGVVAAAVHPDDGLMPGRGALVLFRLDAEEPRQLVLDPVLGPVMAFDGAGFSYPGTLFGVIAYMRQAMEDANRHAEIMASYQRDPRGLTAPEWDPDYEVVRNVTTGAVPVFFRADDAEDIRRVFELSDEYGLRPVIVGGDEAWKVAPELRERGVPVLVSLDFPEPDRWDPDAEGEASSEETEEADARAELDPEVLREKERFENLYSNAGRLAEAGVTFALTSGGGDADLMEGVRKAVEHGLSEDDALAALTATPADLLGAEGLGSVRTGFPANLVVTDGPLFGEDTRIAYTFVEGRLQEGRPAQAAPEEEPSVDLTGSWSVTLESPQGEQEGTMTLDQQGAFFDGSLDAPFGTMEVTDGTVSGSDVSFTLVLDTGGQTLEFSMTGTAEGEDSMSGSGSGPQGMGNIQWSATREGTPEEVEVR